MNEAQFITNTNSRARGLRFGPNDRQLIGFHFAIWAFSAQPNSCGLMPMPSAQCRRRADRSRSKSCKLEASMEEVDEQCIRILPHKLVLQKKELALQWLIGSPFLSPLTIASTLKCIHHLSPPESISPDFTKEAGKYVYVSFAKIQADLGELFSCSIYF